MFSGGIFYNVLTQKDEDERIAWVQKIMPYGGVAMIAGFTLMAFI
jgi:uncharacterized membrane protein YgdD (TMEM256/DUF423 family)